MHVWNGKQHLLLKYPHDHSASIFVATKKSSPKRAATHGLTKRLSGLSAIPNLKGDLSPFG